MITVSEIEKQQWQLYEKLFANNFLLPEKREDSVLPKRIHQVWLGSPLPDKYKKWTESWKRINPDWEYRLWTDKDLGDVDIPRRKLFDKINHLGQKSDFLRYHILNQYGGVYADTDFECLRPLDTLTYLKFFTSKTYSKSTMELFIGLIGSIPHHPILERLIHSMKRADDRTWRRIFNTTGSYFFTSVFFETITSFTKDIVIFPPDYFYPFPNTDRHSEREPHTYIKAHSYAIHYWEVSWSRKKKRYVS